MQWKLLNSHIRLQTVPFRVEELDLVNNAGVQPDHPYYRLSCQNWVNIVPIKSDGSVILIKQSRVGSMSDVLEIPGGVIDPHETDPAAAAARELEEETGFTSSNLTLIGDINPNPAIMTNRMFMYLALDCHEPNNRAHFPDKDEDISILSIPFEEAVDLVLKSEMDHCLAALAILLAKEHLKK